jgi:hypothetical protein
MDTTKVLEAIETLQAAGLLKWETFYQSIQESIITATLGKVALVNRDNGEVGLSFGNSNFVGETSPLGAILAIPATSPLVKVAKAAQAAGATV